MPKDSFYFSHDNNARNDEKILCLMADHGLEGYGIYWVLIEMMHESQDTSLRFDRLKGIAYQYNLVITTLLQCINDAITYGLFESDDETFWSESLRSRKEQWKQKQEILSISGQKGMAQRWDKINQAITTLLPPYNEVITTLLPPYNNKKKVKEIKKSLELVPPSLSPPTSLPPPSTTYPTRTELDSTDIVRSTGKKPTPITEAEWIESLKSEPTYQGIDIDACRARAETWCIRNARKFTRKFFINWLSREDVPLSPSKPKPVNPAKYCERCGETHSGGTNSCDMGKVIRKGMREHEMAMATNGNGGQ